MRKIKMLSVLVLSLFYFSSCQDDELRISNKVNPTESSMNTQEKDIIEGLKISLKHFRKVQSKDKSAKKNPLSLEEQYRINLEHINKETGLNLEFDSSEFKQMLNSLSGDETIGFSENPEKYTESVEYSKELGTYETLKKAEEVISMVYNNNSPYSKGGWGCGLAIASDFVATLSLAGCVTGVGCPLAIAGKALALASLIESCR